jgi:uncharacterized membrane protein
MDKERQLLILEEKLDNLNRSMGRFQLQIMELRQEIEVLKKSPATETNQTPVFESPIIQTPDNQILSEQIPEPSINLNPSSQSSSEWINPDNTAHSTSDTSSGNPSFFNLEDYIGGNIISKLGIFILILGVGFFVNYAIEHNLISPWGRVGLAYLAGGILIGLGYWLKPSYRAYSAVLLSGGIAILYFSTFLGYHFFGLIPQGLAFALMLALTIYTVWEATKYDEEIIGIIGLVGAYAVPFLLSNGSGRGEILFAYITLINAGVLVLAFRRDWQKMNALAFVFTWLILLVWLGNSYQLADFYAIWGFNFVFFIIFYLALVVHQVKHQQKFSEARVFILLLNSALFFLVGIILTQDSSELREINIFQISAQSHYFLFFTLFNCLIHSLVSVYWFRNVTHDVQIKYFSAGFAILFLTLAVPIYFKTEIMTLVWIIESVFLFALSRRERIFFFEQTSWLLALVSTISIGFNFSSYWMSYGWLTETFILFWLARRLKSPFFEYLAYWVAAAAALSVAFFLANEWLIGFWLVEVLLLFGLGRKYQSEYFENISLGLWLVILFILGGFWYQSYFLIDIQIKFPLVFNVAFLMVLLTVLSLGIMLFIHWKIPFVILRPIDNQAINSENQPELETNSTDTFAQWLGKDRIWLGNYGILIILIALYGLGFGEIWRYFQFDYLYRNSLIINALKPNETYPESQFKEIIHFARLGLLFYSAAFGILLFIGTKQFYFNRFGAMVCSAFGALFTLSFVLVGLVDIYALRQLYLFPNAGHPSSDWYVIIRFVLYLAVGLVVASYFWARVSKLILDKSQHKILSIYLNILVLITLSFELTNLLILSSLRTPEAIQTAENLAFKLGFTLLWAIYSLGLIGYGIGRKRKFLRMLGITIFGITLGKLFLNDVNYSSPLAVIFAFIGVGVLLLVTAFLYQKYKHIILADDEISPTEEFKK